MENPNTTLGNAVPAPEFHSRFSDPSHPARNGDPLALLTGGKISRTSPDGRRRGLIGSVVAGIANSASGSSNSNTSREHYGKQSSPPAPYGSSPTHALYSGESYGKEDPYSRSDYYEGNSTYERDDYYGRRRRRDHRGGYDGYGRSRRQDQRPRGLIGMVRKKLKTVSPARIDLSASGILANIDKGVLYLAIVNYPTEEELQEAQHALQAQSVAR